MIHPVIKETTAMGPSSFSLHKNPLSISPLAKAIKPAEPLPPWLFDSYKMNSRIKGSAPVVPVTKEAAIKSVEELAKLLRTMELLAPDLGHQCKDGGRCHHECKDSCFREDGCSPLSGSGFDDNWRPSLTLLAKPSIPLCLTTNL